MNELTSFSLVGFNPWKDNLLTITFLNFRPLNDSVLLGLGFLYFPHPYLRLSKFALNLEIGSGPISTEPGGTSFQTTGLYWAREPVLMVTGFVGDVSGDVHWLLGSDLVFTDKLDTGRLLLCGWCCLRLSGSGYPSLSGGFLFLPGYLCSRGSFGGEPASNMPRSCLATSLCWSSHLLNCASHLSSCTTWPVASCSWITGGAGSCCIIGCSCSRGGMIGCGLWVLHVVMLKSYSSSSYIGCCCGRVGIFGLILRIFISLMSLLFVRCPLLSTISLPFTCSTL